MIRQAIAFAPASVGNVSVGFDILGHSIEGPGDRVTVRRVPSRDVRIAAVRGIDAPLPTDAASNTAGAALIALSRALALPFGFGETTTAQAAVLNFQGNSGAVSATSEQASYLVALNGTDTPTLTNATVNVIGNAVSASAYGNSATNQVTAVALNTNSPTIAVSNYQTNSGPVTASVSTVTYGVTSGLGAITGSSIGVNSNSITATAVGNSATSSIVAAH